MPPYYYNSLLFPMINGTLGAKCKYREVITILNVQEHCCSSRWSSNL